MTLLGTLLVNLFSGLMNFFVHFMTKKIAFGVAVTVTLGGIIAAVIGTMRALVAGIAVAASDPAFLMGLSIGFPSNAPTCMAAIATCWAACTLYSWQKSALDLFAKVS